MEQLAIFEEKVAISPSQLRAKITSFNDMLMNKLRTQLEGKCSKHGFVIPGSLKLLSRSYGYMERGTFTADSMYYIKAEGLVYNPPNGTVVDGVVTRKSKAGLYVIIKVGNIDAIHIMIVRDLHIGNVEFDSIELGEKIRIEIKKSRFQINDPHILSIGQFLGRVASVPLTTDALASNTIGPSKEVSEKEVEEGDEEGDEEGEEGEEEEGEGEEGEEEEGEEEEGEGEEADEGDQGEEGDGKEADEGEGKDSA